MFKKGDLVYHTAVGWGAHMGIVVSDTPLQQSSPHGTYLPKYHVHWLVLPANCSHLLKWQPSDQLEKLNDKRI
jgi:hypothetical protein